MRKLQCKNKTVAKQAEAPLSLTANLDSQYNFMHCWQACLRRFVQAMHFHFQACFTSVYSFHFLYLHVTHQALLASSLRLHSFQSFHWFRSSAPTAQRSCRPFLRSWLWPKPLQQSPTSAKPQWRFCPRELPLVAGS